ncbi:zinc ribbon domain-containing protein [Carboxydochorda subterranea]|uniref:Zinc ribbon domain-containing protein n=1 Tax=Carboxydichorda subterranea TaxID=3109565 RepID=A0ABZ1C076_9FIRM|nr:zinc ribbon domain-containing protein [Limnochorda sp. L945t]WRP18181.1 zinc ribbon domain-containing protein [Limnochorda sp. L945t]
MIYEYRCKQCSKRFDVHATLAEKEAGLSPVCPSCGSTDVARLFGNIMVLRSSRGGDGDAGSGDDGGLGDGGGPGSDRGPGGDDFGGDFDGPEDLDGGDDFDEL